VGNSWITDWALVNDANRYVVFPINQERGRLYVGQPVGNQAGWQVKRLRPGCYAALPLPPFTLTREQLDAQDGRILP
jgi:hypothetical protein